MIINGIPNVAVPMQPPGDYRAGVQNIQGIPIANQMQQYVPVDASGIIQGGTQVAIQQGVNGITVIVIGNNIQCILIVN